MALIHHRMVLVASILPELSNGLVLMAQTMMANENGGVVEGLKFVGDERKGHDDDYLQLSC